MHGTVDSVFTLKTLTDKHVKPKPQKHRNASSALEKPSTSVYPDTELVDKLTKKGLQGRFLEF